jgi:hypothetical protein
MGLGPVPDPAVVNLDGVVQFAIGGCMIRPGEIDLAEFEEMEPRPVVIVSREELKRCNWVAAVLIISKRFEERSKQPNCVPFRAGEFGPDGECVARAESPIHGEEAARLQPPRRNRRPVMLLKMNVS